MISSFEIITKIKPKKIISGKDILYIIDLQNNLLSFSYVGNKYEVNKHGKAIDISIDSDLNMAIIREDHSAVVTGGYSGPGGYRILVTGEQVIGPDKVLKAEGNFLIDSNNNLWWIAFPTAEKYEDIKIKDISTGSGDVLFISMNDEICDLMSNGQLIKVSDIKAKQIASTEDSGLIIDLDNNVWAYGFFGLRLVNIHETRAYANPHGREIDISHPEPVLDPQGKQFKANQVSNGQILDLNGTLWTYLLTGYSSLPNFLVSQVSSGDNFTAIIGTKLE